MEAPRPRPSEPPASDPADIGDVGAAQDLVAHGREPVRAPRRRRAGSGRPRQALTAALTLAALLAGGFWYANRHAERAPVARASVPAPFDTTGVDLAVGSMDTRHDLTALAVPIPPEDRFSAAGGHVTLFVQVRNDGPDPVEVVDGAVRQAGAVHDPTAGQPPAGTSGGTVLAPGAVGEVFLRLRVDCTAALSGAPGTEVVLVAELAGQRRALEVLRIDRVAPLWDEARQAACGRVDPARAVTARLVPGTVQGQDGSQGPRSIALALELHNSAGSVAVVRARPGTAAGLGGYWHGTVGSEGLSVAGGSTQTVLGGWRVEDCARAPTTPPVPEFVVHLADGDVPVTVDEGNGWLGPAWQRAVEVACSGPATA